MKMTLTTFPNWKSFQGKGRGMAKICDVETGRKKNKQAKKKTKSGKDQIVEHKGAVLLRIVIR